jgi:transposase
MAVRCAATAAGGRSNGSLRSFRNFRRLVVRYERHTLNFLGFVHLGCILMLLRQGV